MIGASCGRSRLPVAPKVRADHFEAGVDQPGRHLPPGGVGPGVAVEQDDRGATTTVAHPDPYLVELDVFEGEALEVGLLPRTGHGTEATLTGRATLAA